ncbi:MAG: hypothetical protein RLZZ127_57 [Planctomycetota bacterium]|jgi:hypothetical protein
MDLIAVAEKFGVVAVSAIAAAWLAWFLLRHILKQQDARIERLETKNDATEAYIRKELSDHLSEAHARERRLASIIARMDGDGADDPQPAPDRRASLAEADTEIIGQPRHALTPRGRRATIRDDDSGNPR